jgi:hypothetical protein
MTHRWMHEALSCALLHMSYLIFRGTTYASITSIILKLGGWKPCKVIDLGLQQGQGHFRTEPPLFVTGPEFWILASGPPFHGHVHFHALLDSFDFFKS